MWNALISEFHQNKVTLASLLIKVLVTEHTPIAPNHTLSCCASSLLSWNISPFSSCFTNSFKLKELYTNSVVIIWRILELCEFLSCSD